jgi:CubicO group peptidase (beta-lactamase class C family)
MPSVPAPRLRVLLLAAPLALAAGASAPASLRAQPAATPVARRSSDGAAERAALATRLDSVTAAWLAEGTSPGVSVAVVRGRDTLLLKGYGVADRASSTPVTPATVFRIGSVTKQFTAALVMQLVEQRKVALDDSIAAHLAGLPAAWRGVTVRQLLNHTSGIPSYTDLGPSWRARWAEDMTPDTLAALTAAQPMTFAPGAGWKYNNTGYVLLGMLVERKLGKPYAAAVAERIARPLGLASTGYCPPALPAAGHASGYARQGGAFVDAPKLSMTQPYAAGSLCSTPADLARWNAALATGRVVSPASWALMTTPTGAAAAQGYGFGIGSGAFAGHRRVSHSGGVHGFVSQNAYYPDDSLSVAVLTNANGADPAALLADLSRVALGIPLAKAPTVVALGAAERAPYVGSYDVRLPSGTVWRTRVWEAGDRLVLKADAPGQGEIPLLAYGDHTFGAATDKTLRFRFTVESGRASRLAVTQRGNTFEGGRVDEASAAR